MTIGSLFSGITIGGLELGLEWAGLGPTKWQVERDEYATRVLARHWPDAKRFDDVCAVGATNLEPVDLICGGFPCPDISTAGTGAGLDGDRSRLWFEFLRIVRELRPCFVVVENVAALAFRGLDRVLAGLADVGFDAEWSTVSACSVGAPHMRRRLFIVAYANGEHGRTRIRNIKPASMRSIQAVHSLESSRANWRAWMENPSELYRGAHGVPNGSHRTRATGNAVLPQVGYLIGQVVHMIKAAA